MLNLIQRRYLSYKQIRTWYAKLVKPKKNEAPYSHIIQVGDPTLRVVSDKVPTDLVTAPEIKFLIDRMKSVFNRYNCVGLSATQIGIPIQIFMMEFNKKHMAYFSKKEQASKELALCPFKIVINPEIKILDYSKIMFPEACESVKGFYADVPRFRSINLKGVDEKGNAFSEDYKGWLARIIQHEVDHINGKIYIDIMDRTTFTCSCWNVINERRGKVELPYGPE